MTQVFVKDRERKARVFKVRIINRDGNETMLVRAQSAAQAMKYVTMKHIECTPATHEDALEFGVAGGRIEDAIP